MKRTTLHDAYAGIGRGVKNLQKENKELLARITALETAGRDVVTSVNGSFRQELTIAKLAALLNNPPLEKE